MIKTPSPGRRNSVILLGATLGVAVILTLLLFFLPEKDGRSTEAQGVLLYPGGESTVCTVSLQGVMKTYTLRGTTIYEGTLLVDGQAVGEVLLTFDGDCAAGTEGMPAMMTEKMEIAAQINRDGRDCLVLAPALDEEAAQALLSQFLSGSVFARQQGWEAFQ